MPTPLAPSERNNLKQRLAGRKRVVGQEVGPKPRAPHVETHNEKALRLATSELAYRWKKALDLCERLDSAGHPRAEEAWKKFYEIQEQYMYTYNLWQDAAQFGPLYCVSCEIEAEQTVDMSNLPVNARLCAVHARDLLVVDAMLRRRREGLGSTSAKTYYAMPGEGEED